MTSETLAAPTSTQNAEQIAYWNSAVADRWARRQAEIDAMMEPFTHALLGAANLGPDGPWRILDVGCGAGETTLLAAEIGHDVTGLDVSTSLLELAKTRAKKAGLTSANFFLGDASQMFIDPPFDLVMSRFGIMFFDDPVKAFTNLAKLTKTGGRIVFVCWRSPKENQWVTLPMSALNGLIQEGGPPQTDGPGPFAFADPEKVRGVLDGAGFSDIRITPFDGEMVMGVAKGVESAATYLAEIGPVARAISELSKDLRPVVLARLEGIIAPLMRDNALLLQGGVWVVEATRL
jgi:ubiquinone/menaquinone biosynthesis C-methylase UbiE